MEISANAHSEVTGDKKNMTARCLEELSAAQQPEDLHLATFSFVIEELLKLCMVFYPRHTVFGKLYDGTQNPKSEIRVLLFPSRDTGLLQRPYNFRA